MPRLPLLVTACGGLAGLSDGSQVLLVGLYQSSGKSVLSYAFDGSTSIVPLSSSDIGAGPSWIIPAGQPPKSSFRPTPYKSLVATSETGGTVASLSLDCSGKVAVTSRVMSGANPVFLATDHNSSHVLSANYGAGSISVFPQSWIADNATLAPASQTLEFGAKAHAHSAYFAPPWAGDMPHAPVFVPTLGLDQVQQLYFTNGKLVHAHDPLIVPSQQGPRHMAFHPIEPIAVLANEGSATANVTIELLTYNRHIGLSTIATYNAGGPYSAPDLYPAEVLFDKQGQFVLVSLWDLTDQKRDGVAVFKLCSGPMGASFSLVDYAAVGHYPRSMTLADTGLLIVGNQKGNSLSFLNLDFSTGKVTKVKEDLIIGDSPAFVGIFDFSDECNHKTDAKKTVVV
jgi:6-phosphogluconolactonase (cycloisomerase 2 family)